MAQMKVFRPGCAEDGCTRAPKWEVESADGKAHGLYCGAHATKALRTLEDHERTQKARPTQPTAVKA